MAKNSEGSKYSFYDDLQNEIVNIAEVARDGSVKIKKTDLKKSLEVVFERATKAAAGGEKIKFPVIGTLLRKDVEARKAGKGINPFTKEPVTIKARPASKKPRWSFPKSAKDIFSNKKYW